IAKYRADVAARRFTQGIRRASELEGMLAVAEDRWDDAIAALKKANLQDPYNLYRLALAYEGARQTEEAKSYYKQTVDLNQLLNLNYEFVRNKARVRLMGLRALASLEQRGLRVGEKLPAFALNDQHGRRQTLDMLAGPNGLVLLLVRS